MLLRLPRSKPCFLLVIHFYGTPKLPIRYLGADIASLQRHFHFCSAYDLENKVIGTVGAGRIGQRVLSRLQVSLPASTLISGPFD